MRYCLRRLTALFGLLIAKLLSLCGPTLIKVGQALATRADLFSEDFCAALGRLQDRLPQLPYAEVRATLAREYGPSWAEIFAEFDEDPIATANIAQVHVARLATGDPVAVKVLRPGIRARFVRDARRLNRLVFWMHRLGFLRGVPVVDACSQICDLLIAQTDLRAEAAAHAEFSAALEDLAWIPTLRTEYCTSSVLVMEYIPGLKRLSRPDVDPQNRIKCAGLALDSIYRMLFRTGVIHCDLHSSNILWHAKSERLVILDFGFHARLDRIERLYFCRFFLSVATADGATAAEILLATAQSTSSSFRRESFELAVGKLVERSSRLAASEFSIQQFVRSLFDIQYKNGVNGSPAFTMAILSLLILEGTIIALAPDLDFQREAIPYLCDALAEESNDLEVLPDSVKILG